MVRAFAMSMVACVSGCPAAEQNTDYEGPNVFYDESGNVRDFEACCAMCCYQPHAEGPADSFTFVEWSDRNACYCKAYSQQTVAQNKKDMYSARCDNYVASNTTMSVSTPVKLEFEEVEVPEPTDIQVGTQSCDAYCTSKFGSQSQGYVMGTAPFCGGDCYDCHDGDFCGPLAKDFPDGGHTCATGSKQCCCTRTSGAPLTVAASAQSCDAYCTSKGIKYGYVRGTAPFCGAGPNDCCDHDYPGIQASSFSDGGDSCWTGSKQCCCGTPVGQSSCPKPGPSDLSCNIISQVCKLIAKKAISSTGACTELAAEGVGLCEAVGLGPEDPWADACAAVIGTSIKVGCDQVVKKLGQFGADECTKAAGCEVSSMAYNHRQFMVI